MTELLFIEALQQEDLEADSCILLIDWSSIQLRTHIRAPMLNSIPMTCWTDPRLNVCQQHIHTITCLLCSVAEYRLLKHA